MAQKFTCLMVRPMRRCNQIEGQELNHLLERPCTCFWPKWAPSTKQEVVMTQNDKQSMKAFESFLGERDRMAMEFAKDHCPDAQFADDCLLRTEHAFKSGAAWQATKLLPVIARLGHDYKRLSDAVNTALSSLAVTAIHTGSEIHKRLKEALK